MLLSTSLNFVHIIKNILLSRFFTLLIMLFSANLYALPDWVKQPPLDDDKFIYGIGSGIDFETAKKNALSDIAAKFNANVKESYVSAQRVLNEKITSDVKINTQVEVQGTRLNHFHVSKSDTENNIYWTLVQLDRLAFAKDLYAHWFKVDKEMATNIKQIGTVPSLLHIDKLKPLLEKNEQLKAILVQSNFIQPRTDFKTAFSLYNHYQSLLNTLLDNQFVLVTFNDVDDSLAAVIKEQLTAKGLKLLDQQNTQAPYSVIAVSLTKQQREDDRNAFISQIELYIETTADNNENIGSNHFSARGRDYVSHVASFEKATISIQRQLNKLPLDALLNISSK
ncbi:LPP20 family lipoprotein [Paraglaciecola hydrolytica]|uniref:Lipoprotein LPP20-like domain-containing protein n=1 Tax=Paraglaciecola hydrolytica TaxID=1799789 RepID=A0A136A1Y9_9ALTE|nr:LPP20 family lipoprotein [Paraglaciecola hydrolytica]KXI29245.1 hypothetical protein AX660_13950 [Paraglaciecola hydrolytica]